MLAGCCRWRSPRPARSATLHAQGLPAAPPESVGMSAERLARLTRVMDEAVKSKQIAGTVTSIARGGRTIYFEAAGHARHRGERPDDEGHDLSHRLTVEGHHQRRRDDPGGGGAAAPHRSGLEIHSGVREHDGSRDGHRRARSTRSPRGGPSPFAICSPTPPACRTAASPTCRRCIRPRVSPSGISPTRRSRLASGSKSSPRCRSSRSRASASSTATRRTPSAT